MPRSPNPVFTWRYQVNNAISEASADVMREELLYQMKQALIGAGSWTDNEGTAAAAPTFWTVDYSCDPDTATGTPGDAVDRWTSNGAITFETSGNPFSWIVFVHANFFGTGQPLYMLWTCTEGSAGNAGSTIGIHLSEAGFTGGTDDTRPTATDEHTVLGDFGTGASNSSGWQGNGASDLAKSLHFCMTDDGTKFRAHITEDGLCEARWDLFLVEDAPVGWDRPVLMSVMSENSNEEHNTWVNCWNSVSHGGRYHGYDGTLGAFICQAGVPRFSSSEAAFTAEAGNSFDGTIMPFPICLRGDGTPVSGLVAVVPDCWWVSGSNGTGDQAEDDEANSNQFAQFGDMMIEWNRSNLVT